jgi:3-hydroxyisobutyrate dehydrogenase-like beta-hydroxyacid dehydrogenase
MSGISSIDQQKVQKLLTEAANSSKSSVAVVMDVETVSLLTEYAESITTSILEGGIALSQAKRGTIIDESDIALLLQKRLGEEVAGKDYPNQLHSHAIKSSISSNLGPEDVDMIARRRNKFKS